MLDYIYHGNHKPQDPHNCKLYAWVDVVLSPPLIKLFLLYKSNTDLRHSEMGNDFSSS